MNSNLEKGIAYQIRATRDDRQWTQAELAAAAGMAQNNISRLESPDYGKQTLSSLKRIAKALDVALVVRLVPFSQYIDWLSGTPYLDQGLHAESLAVSSFEKESSNGIFEREERHYTIHVNPGQVMTATNSGLVTPSGQRSLFTLPLAPQLSGSYQSTISPLTSGRKAS